MNFYVAYYASQRKGESPHSPIVCIPGGGWTITNIQQELLVVATIRLIVSSSKSAMPLNLSTIGSTNAAERLQAKFGRSFTFSPMRSCKIGRMAPWCD